MLELILTETNITAFSQLLIALLLGMLIGTERSIAGKTAGMRTYGLVSLGSALFVIVSLGLLGQLGEASNVDPSRIISGVATGMGFIGAGIIILKGHKLTGLTTAAGLWVSAGVGLAVGIKLYSVAVLAAVLTILTFTLFWFVEDRVRDIAD